MAAAFIAADLKRAIKIATAAGMPVAAIDFPLEGGFRLLFGDPTVLKLPNLGGRNEWDDVLPAS